MDQDKFEFFCGCFEDAFKKSIVEIADVQMESCNESHKGSEKKFSAIVGVTGLCRGQIQVTMTEKLIQKLYESTNDEPINDKMDLCFYLAELTNMLSGRGITMLNNNYKGSNLRLTPPAFFADEKTDIATSRLQSFSRIYYSNYGQIRFEIGFENVN